MKKYDKWYISRGDKVIWCGSLTKLLEKYKLTHEQFYTMIKNQQFPYGEINKKVDYYDFTIEKSFSFKNQNLISYMKCLCRNALIGMLENNEYIDASVDSVMNNEYENLNTKLIENMAKIAFKLNKISIHINDHPIAINKKIISIRLPMKEYPSCCFIVHDFELKNDYNNGYRLIKDIFKEIQDLRNMSSSYIGKIIYKGTSRYNYDTGRWNNDIIRPANEKFDMRCYIPDDKIQDYYRKVYLNPLNIF